MNQVATQAQILEQVLISGDLAKLTSEQKVLHLKSVCESLGLNPLTRPFEYISLNGRLTLYAKRDATDQLRKIHGVSIKIVSREVIEGIYVVTAQAKDSLGREDESTGAVLIDGLKGDYRANAMLKAETKAKRRVTLSICGLGFLDETEVESIPPAMPSTKPGTLSSPKIAQDEGYRVPFGKHKDKTLEDIDPKALAEYCAWIRAEADRTKKEIKDPVLTFLHRAENYLDNLVVAEPIENEFGDRE